MVLACRKFHIQCPTFSVKMEGSVTGVPGRGGGVELHGLIVSFHVRLFHDAQVVLTHQRPRLESRATSLEGSEVEGDVKDLGERFQMCMIQI